MRLLFFGLLAAMAATAPARAGLYTFITLDVPGANPSYFGTEAFGINTSGQVVGTYTASTGLQGFVYDQSTASYTLFSDPAATAGIIAQGINDAGQVVGTRPFAADRIFLRDPSSGTFTNLASPASQVYPTATGINLAGQVLGYYTDYTNPIPGLTSFVRDTATSTYTPLQDPNSGSASTPSFTLASGINNTGEVVGFFQSMDSLYNGFLFDPTTGIYTTLNFPTASGTFAQGINNAGQIVGYYTVNQSTESFLLDLATNTFTTLSDPDAVSTFARGINDAGQIVGYFTDVDGVPNAFLATPIVTASVPEPGSVAMLGLAAFSLAMIRSRRPKIS